jgi:galactose mutarotase-like enzyme
MIIENEFLTVSLAPKGAELQSIYNKQTQLDYLWSGDPKYWGKHAPVLFPIVGTLKDNIYRYQELTYTLARHGFARDMEFTVIDHQKSAASFELRSSKTTLANFPFPFILRIHYLLDGNKLINQYEVVNPSDEQMLFSIGGHPAFNVPLEAGLTYEDYYLEFSELETRSRWTLENNLLKDEEPFLMSNSVIPLSHSLFSSDAIILKQPLSREISLKSDKSAHGLTMTIGDFPFLGIWAAPQAPFVCIEPWCGLADSVYHNQDLEQKEGIMFLGPESTWSKSWDVSFW